MLKHQFGTINRALCARPIASTRQCRATALDVVARQRVPPKQGNQGKKPSGGGGNSEAAAAARAEKDAAPSDAINISGVVTNVLPNGYYRVKLENNFEVLAHLSGKMRKNTIWVSLGDTVVVELSPYDLTRGRIVRREQVQRRQMQQQQQPMQPMGAEAGANGNGAGNGAGPAV